MTYYLMKFDVLYVGTKTVYAKSDKGAKFQVGDRVRFNGYGYSGYATIAEILDKSEAPTSGEIYEIL